MTVVNFIQNCSSNLLIFYEKERFISPHESYNYYSVRIGTFYVPKTSVTSG